MNRVLRNASLHARCLLRPPTSKPALNPSPSSSFSESARPLPRRFCSSGNESSGETPKTAASETGLAPPEAKEVAVDAAPQKKDVSLDVKDVSNKELKMMIDKYFGGDEEALPSILEGILQRKLAGKHEETDDEVTEELRMQPIDDVKDTEFESDFEDAYETDEEIDNLYNATEIVKKRMVTDEYFNMSDTKWDEMIAEAVSHGHLMDTKECEQVLEDMLSWDKLLPDEMKKEVEQKYNELGDMCERGELQPEEAFEQFKKFEDEMVMKYGKMMEKEAPQFDETAVPDKKKDLDDPPGEGPILRWQTRVVFAPGGDAWHPKNRKVKMAVTVKELGLSKYQFRRLRELVGKRYNPGKDELMITSERFEHREENRKDCLRTLLSLIEEAGKANKLVDDARALYVKSRLRANPAFMERLRAKTEKMRASSAVPA
ncbi:MRP-S28 domain-containing protein [Psidium guajava]|nr:MRP-S28 domain-containing protein [Psidium guajava]